MGPQADWSDSFYKRYTLGLTLERVVACDNAAR